MNDKQLKRAQLQLRNEMNENGFGFINGKYIKPPEKYRRRIKELSCISMINSILAYTWHGQTAEDVMEQESQPHRHYLTQYVNEFGKKYVTHLIREQINSIKTIRIATYVDGEGVSYNTIVWKDE